MTEWKGSVVAVQERMDRDCIMNVYDGMEGVSGCCSVEDGQGLYNECI